MKLSSPGAVRRHSPLLPVLLAGALLAACGPNRGPDYGADPVDSQALAIPPDLTAEPLATQNPFPDLPDISQYRPGPESAEADGKWLARIDGNTMAVPVPSGWALGSVRAALLLQGVAVGQEREGTLRTPWLAAADLRHLGVKPPEDGRLRYTVRAESQSGGATRLLVQAERRDGDDVVRAANERVGQFLQALQPAFGKRRSAAPKAGGQ
ncbi:MAG TPA: hypothetical protein VKA55_05475 [Gammaproteobacteria bacterium]|nr:hypothetical protein [Gammaproteobacteria bacterium]